ncbi:nuclease-related domain-containing protein [Paenisporosarcina sp. TG-14]|uniref:nuclease-related domain-containing protein n=1 Tax=Paenisporosarcina sp. TG-14 TaxID=1231057 RepID=UPI00030B42FE|nr:nuclease-related domain-containing protein [Paenisporosarcina sp. TG-14]
MDTLRIPPKTIQVYKRLLHRFPHNHPFKKDIQAKIKSIEAGYFGERYVDHFLNQIDFPKPYTILKDIHIQIRPDSYLQIDTLIITRKYIAILEIKNIKGKIYFQQNPKQLVRDLNGEITTYKCPEQQILRHHKKLHYLLQQLKISIPIEKRIVFAFSSTHIFNPPEDVKVLMGCDVSNHIDELNELPNVISTSTFNRLSKSLISLSTNYFPQALAETYPINLKDLKTGLICSECQNNTHQNRCPTCKISKKTLQKQAIEDWFYLCKNSISNNECLHFLDLKDKYAASYLLKNIGLEAINNNKYRRYTYSTSFWLTKESDTTYK